MKVLTQNREVVLEYPKDIWVTTVGEEGKGLVIAGGAMFCHGNIGEYKDIDRAKEILRDMLDKYSKGEPVYIMPEE